MCNNILFTVVAVWMTWRKTTRRRRQLRSTGILYYVGTRRQRNQKSHKESIAYIEKKNKKLKNIKIRPVASEYVCVLWRPSMKKTKK